MAIKVCENHIYQKVDWNNKKIRPEIRKKIDNWEDLTKEDYETMTYGEWFYIWNGFTLEDVESGKTNGHYVIG